MSATLEHIYAPILQTKRGAPVFMGYSPKHKNIVYCCGNAVVIRNLENPLEADMYYAHGCQVTCAKYSPSGYYIASGDIQGKVRVWDTTQKEHPLKLECRPLSGAISDLNWSGDNQRIVVAGDGKERFGAVFMADAGSSVGEIAGHTKPLMSCDIRQARPFRVATGGEDTQVNWFEGPPFKFKKSMRDHERMITCVRFSPDGAFVATCGTDKKINIYDGKTGEKLHTYTGLHTGGIYSISWLDDNKTLLTASADKTATLMDSTTGSEVARFKFGGAKPTTNDQQLGCLWTKEAVMTVNLDGEISIVDPANPAAAPRVITGHNKGVYAVAAKDGKFYTGGTERIIIQWDAATGAQKRLTGSGHNNQISAIVVQGNTIISGAYDNTIRFTPVDTLEYGNSVSTDAPVMGIAAGPKSDVVVATTKTTAYVIRGGKIASSIPITYTATCISINPAENEVAIGGEDCKIHIYKLAGDALEQVKELDGLRGVLSCLAYSPDGAHLASSDASRNILVWDAAAKTIKVQGWVFHAAGIKSIAWSPDNVHLSSAGVDSDIYVWSVAEPSKKAFVKAAHPGGALATTWLNEKTVLTAGQDCAIKSWTVAF